MFKPKITDEWYKEALKCEEEVADVSAGPLIRPHVPSTGDHMQQPTFENTLLSDYRHFGDAVIFHKVALEAGYPFYIWNDRVYRTSANSNSREDTGFVYDRARKAIVAEGD
jgi:hypothetical protein